MNAPEDIQISRNGPIGHIVLNRPNALNAITFDMVTAIAQALSDWREDPDVRAVFIEGEGHRAFCAGGDVLAVRDAALNGAELAKTFFQVEYTLNRAIHLYPKPYISFLDGIVMGGGCGLSIHGSHRISTENTLFAMPETGIGLFPDVGGSCFLSRCPGEIGVYAGLTGARLKAADLAYAGLVDSHVPADARDALLAALVSADWTAGAAQDVARNVIDRFSQNPEDAPLAADRAAIDRLFQSDRVETIVSALEADGGEFAARALKLLLSKSPTMTKVALEQLRRGARQDFDANMIMEYRMVRRALKPGADFYEGVRALLIDKDKDFHWSPSTLDAVDDALVAEFLDPPEEGDLAF